MTEPTNDLPRPELCSACEYNAKENALIACTKFGATCSGRQRLWDSGYAAGARGLEAATALAKTAHAGRVAAESKLAESEKMHLRTLRQRDEAERVETEERMRCKRAEEKLAELVRRVREWWSDGEPCGKQLERMLREYDKPEGG